MDQRTDETDQVKEQMSFYQMKADLNEQRFEDAGKLKMCEGLLFLFIGFQEAQVLEPACPAYCSRGGQQKNSFQCPSINDTRNSIFCCGSNVFKYCCADRDQEAPVSDNTYCDNGPRIKYDWIIIVTIVMTVVVFVLGLMGCLCLCHKKCGCKNVIYSDSGEPQSIYESVPPDSAALQSSTASDFDPTSACAFSPPAYDTLPKHPPAYAEIFTISNGCSSYDQTQTSLHMESICNSVNQGLPLPEYTNLAHTEEETVITGGGDSSQSRTTSSVNDRCPPYQPVGTSSTPAPPSCSSRSPGRTHRPSMVLAMELHPLNLGVAGHRLSSSAQARILPSAV